MGGRSSLQRVLHQKDARGILCSCTNLDWKVRGEHLGSLPHCRPTLIPRRSAGRECFVGSSLSGRRLQVIRLGSGNSMCDLGASFAPFQGVMRLAPAVDVGRDAAQIPYPQKGTANRESDHALCLQAPELPRFVLVSRSRMASWTAPNTIRQPSRAAIDPNKQHVPTKTAPTDSR